MKRFLFPTQVITGQGAVAELKRFVSNGQRVFIVTDKPIVGLGLVDKVKAVLDELAADVAVYDDVPPNPHEEDVAACLKTLQEFGGEVVVAVGGGSPMDVAKVVAMIATDGGELEEYQWKFRQAVVAPLPFIAIPTTAGTGSEAAKTAVIVSRDTKKGFGGDALFAKAALLDPEMTAGLPPHLTATTGLDALTHAIEAYVGRNRQPWTDALALEAIALLAEYLPRTYVDGQDLFARQQVMSAAAMAGMAMDQSGLGVVHAVSGPIASHYDVPHGLSNSVLLTAGMRYNLIAAPARYAKIAELMGVSGAGKTTRELAEAGIDAVDQLIFDMQIEPTLSDYFERYGSNDGDIPRFAEEACKMFLMKNNPRVPQQHEIEAMIRDVLLPY